MLGFNVPVLNPHALMLGFNVPGESRFEHLVAINPRFTLWAQKETTDALYFITVELQLCNNILQRQTK